MALYWLASPRCHRVGLDAPSLFTPLGAASVFTDVSCLPSIYHWSRDRFDLVSVAYPHA